MIISAAAPADIEAVAALANRAYRGDSSRSGWTTEAHLLTRARTSAAALAADLADHPGALFLTLRDAADGPLLGSVWLKPQADHSWYLGMFAVEPTLQTGGWGGPCWTRRRSSRANGAPNE